MIDSAIILAAGRGERMRPLTDNIPKPLIRVGDKSLLHRIVSRMLKYKIEHIYYSLGYMWEAVLAHIHSDPVLRESLEGCFIDSTMPGTAYWIYNTIMANCDMPIVVSTADNPMDIDLEAVRSDYRNLREPACMITTVKANGTGGTRIEYDESSRLAHSIIQGDCHNSCFIGSGIQVINPKKIVALSQRSLLSFEDVWKNLIRQGEMYVSRVSPTKWSAIDDERALARARTELR